MVNFWFMRLITTNLDNLKSLAATYAVIDSHVFLYRHLGNVIRALLRPKPSAWLGSGVPGRIPTQEA